MDGGGKRGSGTGPRFVRKKWTHGLVKLEKKRTDFAKIGPS